MKSQIRRSLTDTLTIGAMKKFPCDRPFGFRHFAFRWGLSPSDGNRNQTATATRASSRRGFIPSDDDPMVEHLFWAHVHRKTPATLCRLVNQLFS